MEYNHEGEYHGEKLVLGKWKFELERKLGLLAAFFWSAQNGQRRLDACSSTLDRQKNRIPTAGLVVVIV